jgi:hypothetical protein
MKHQAQVYDTVSIEEVLQVVREAGHEAEIRMNDSGRRTLQCESAGIRYAIQFYPNEGHTQNAFGALRFVAWIGDDAADPEVANAYNSKFRFASMFADENCYEIQHDIVAVGASDQNLITCIQQWGTSLDDCMAFLAEE